MRSSSLANNPLAITREINSKYDAVLEVRDNLGLIEQVAGTDFEAIIAEIEDAKDFTGITVVTGPVTNWNSVNKILTVATVKGDKGDTGAQGLQGIRGLQGIQGPIGLKGSDGTNGLNGLNGAAGTNGLNGMVPILEFSIDIDGDLNYEVVGYEAGPTVGGDTEVEEW